ncbi:MAG: hypothetical protein RL560_24 [Actinomycetota bacterium]|jgi:hypothetical protein
MSAWAFRFTHEDGELSGYYGVVVAKDKLDLFWAIDEFGDPYLCEIKKLDKGGICFKHDASENEYSELEIGESLIPDPEEKESWSRAFNQSFDPIYR